MKTRLQTNEQIKSIIIQLLRNNYSYEEIAQYTANNVYYIKQIHQQILAEEKT